MKRILFLLSVLILSADAAFACTCLPPKSAAEELKRAAAVFSGKVLKIKKHKEADLFTKVEAVFEVEEVWKGVEERKISVFTSSTSAACGYGFKKGQSYLVYAHEDGQARLVTSICSRTKLLDHAVNDLDELGTGKTITKSGERRKLVSEDSYHEIANIHLNHHCGECVVRRQSVVCIRTKQKFQIINCESRG